MHSTILSIAFALLSFNTFAQEDKMVVGECPSVEEIYPIKGKVKLSAKDIRYNQKGNILYGTVLGLPM